MLFAEAQRGGPDAALRARLAGALAELSDPALARQALGLALRLEPRESAPRLALARLHAEAGDFDAARAEAGLVLKDGVDEGARARAAFLLGEIARFQGDAQAREFYETTLRIEEALLSRDRTDATASRWFARARGRLAELDVQAGQIERARIGAEGAIAILYGCASQMGETPIIAADIADAEMRMAALDLDDGKPTQARRRLNTAIQRYEALAITETSEPHWRAVLGDAWALAAEADYLRGAKDEARGAMDKSLQARLKLASDHGEAWSLAGAWRVRAALLAAIDDGAGATESLLHARLLAQRLYARSHGGEAQARFLAHTMLDQADHALRLRDIELAKDAADSARKLCEAFASGDDAAPIWWAEASSCWDRLGEAARLSAVFDKAQDAFARAVQFRRMALSAEPQNLRFKRNLAANLIKLGEAELAAGAPQSARAAFAESAGLRIHLAESAPHDAATAHMLAVALERLGLAARACGDTAGARAAWEEELDLADRIFADQDSLEAHRFRAIVEGHLVSLGGGDADARRRSALTRLDALAQAGALNEQEKALRKRLWSA
jgi:tetratricopeptide (TPR) repeat protein